MHNLSAHDTACRSPRRGRFAPAVAGLSGRLTLTLVLLVFAAAASADDALAPVREDRGAELPPVLGIMQAAGGGLVVAPASIASGFGDALAPRLEAAMEQPLPVELLGVSVRITDSAGVSRLGQLFVVTPNQINFFIDPATALGLALVEALQDGEVIAAGTVQVAAIAPGIFTANADGMGVPAARFQRFRRGQHTGEGVVFNVNEPLGERQPKQLIFGDSGEQLFVILFGTGMRAGALVSATLDGEDIPVSAVFVLDQFVGLDQVNVGPIPRSFISSGVVELQLLIDGVATNLVTLLL